MVLGKSPETSMKNRTGSQKGKGDDEDANRAAHQEERGPSRRSANADKREGGRGHKVGPAVTRVGGSYRTKANLDRKRQIEKIKTRSRATKGKVDREKRGYRRLVGTQGEGCQNKRTRSPVTVEQLTKTEWAKVLKIAYTTYYWTDRVFNYDKSPEKSTVTGPNVRTSQ